MNNMHPYLGLHYEKEKWDREEAENRGSGYAKLPKKSSFGYTDH